MSVQTVLLERGAEFGNRHAGGHVRSPHRVGDQPLVSPVADRSCGLFGKACYSDMADELHRSQTSSLAVGYVTAGSDPATRSVLGLGTAQRNLSAALVVGSRTSVRAKPYAESAIGVG